MFYVDYKLGLNSLKRISTKSCYEVNFDVHVINRKIMKNKLVYFKYTFMPDNKYKTKFQHKTFNALIK